MQGLALLRGGEQRDHGVAESAWVAVVLDEFLHDVALAQVAGQILRFVGLPMTIGSIRGQISAAVRMIVQLQRLSDGKRRVTSVAEITGMEGDIVQMQEIYKFVRTGTADDGTVIGHFQATGVRPRFLAELTARGIRIPGSYFDPSQPLQ